MYTGGAMPVSVRITTILLAAMVMMCGCLAFGPKSKDLPGDYRLVQWEDGNSYYIGKRGEKLQGGGVAGGTIERLGWNDRYIVAWRHSTFQGDPDGWMVIDTRENRVSGPWSDEDLTKRSDEIPALRTIKPRSTSEQWEGR
jgi:hypothetical protein